MTNSTHKIKEVIKIEYVDRHGKKRIRYDTIYERSEETAQEMENFRLGSLSTIPTTQDYRIQDLLNKNYNIFVCPHLDAKVICSTRLRQDKRAHKLMTGSQLLADYFDRDTEGASLDLLGGFPQFKQLFILFGYIEAPNRYIPNLLAQLVGQRFNNGDHVWVFLPKTLVEMSTRWNNSAFLDLNYMDVTQLELNDLTLDVINKGPEATTRASTIESKSNVDSNTVENNPKADKKLGKRKWKSK